jgi:hypothetical protein
MHIGIDVHLWAILSVAAGVVGLCFLALVCLALIAFIPEIEEFIDRVYKRLRELQRKR